MTGKRSTSDGSATPLSQPQDALLDYSEGRLWELGTEDDLQMVVGVVT